MVNSHLLRCMLDPGDEHLLIAHCSTLESLPQMREVAEMATRSDGWLERATHALATPGVLGAADDPHIQLNSRSNRDRWRPPHRALRPSR
jgi:hypothetical protein